MARSKQKPRTKTPAGRRRLEQVIETLESRMLLMHVSSDKSRSGGADWTNPANWSAGSIPSSSDDAIVSIPLSGTGVMPGVQVVDGIGTYTRLIDASGAVSMAAEGHAIQASYSGATYHLSGPLVHGSDGNLYHLSGSSPSVSLPVLGGTPDSVVPAEVLLTYDSSAPLYPATWPIRSPDPDLTAAHNTASEMAVGRRESDAFRTASIDAAPTGDVAEPQSEGMPTSQTIRNLAEDVLPHPDLWFESPNPRFGGRKPADLLGTKEEILLYWLLNAVDSISEGQRLRRPRRYDLSMDTGIEPYG